MMSQITKNTILSELLIEHNNLIPVVNRFGVRLGHNNKSIVAICREHKLNTYFFITILRFYLEDEYIPNEEMFHFDVSDVLDYLKVTVEHYSYASIPNIEKHLTPLMAMSDDEGDTLKDLHSKFYKFKTIFNKHMEMGLESVSEYPPNLLNELKTMLIKNISGNYNLNLVYAVVFSIDALEKELLLHNKIFNLLLRPKLDVLDSENIELLNNIFTDDSKGTDVDSQLTTREIEVLKLIVQGYMNKEMASKLNISLNTVLSHRKNIISKTGIKTVSGLTFYAISNGFVSSGTYRV